MSEMALHDTWLDIEETDNGPLVVNAYTTAELDEMEREGRRSPGICSDLATLPDKAILTESALAKILQVTTRTVRRMVQRNEIPPPVNFAGKSVWFAGSILSHLQARVDRIAKDADRRHAARERLIA